VPCSARTGEGLDALRAAVEAGLADAPGKDPEGLTRLPVDRVFTMKGFGTVVTGTLWAGRVRPGDDLVALPAATPVAGKVRGVQVHGSTVEEARAGQRTAINVAVPREAIERGQTLVRPGEIEPGRLVDVRLNYLPTCKAPLKRRARVLFHAGTAQTLATVSLLDAGALDPGQSGLAQLHLETPMVMLPGDRFILRGFALQRHHGTTLGGGVILRTLGVRTRRGSPELLATLRATEKASPEERVRLEVQRAGTAGVSRAGLQMRLGLTPRAVEAILERLQGARQVVRYDRERGALISAQSLTELKSTVAEALDAFHAAHPLADGMPREELREKITADPKLLHVVLEALGAEKQIVVEREVVRRPGHDVARSRSASGLAPLAERAAELWRKAALGPPRIAEAAVQLGSDAKEVERAVEMLGKGGTLLRVKDLWFHKAAVDELRARLIGHLSEKGQITPQEWKEMVGGTRKFAIPLAEHFDAEKLTLRVGDLRKLRGK
jgi:selenocysteine-specific elongation factor